MPVLWRISNHADLSGHGGLKFASRWTSLGRRIVYLAESPAGAMLETLVHLADPQNPLPRTYTLLQIDAPETLAVQHLPKTDDTNWRESVALTRKLGDAWLDALETPVARVPSAVVPHTWNWLLNPAHPQAQEVRIASVIRERYDNRLFGFAAR